MITKSISESRDDHLTQEDMDSDDKKYVPPPLRSTQGSTRSKPPFPELKMDLTAQAELKRSILEAMKKPLVKGDTWYLCDRAWFDKFKRYTSQGGSDSFSDSDSLSDSDSETFEEASGLSSRHPGQIDLSGLYANSKCDTNNPLHSHEYITIHENGWKRLVEEFGIKEGQKPIRREVVNKRAPRETEVEVEVNFLKLNFVQNDQIDFVRRAQCSRRFTLGMYYKL